MMGKKYFCSKCEKIVEPKFEYGPLPPSTLSVIKSESGYNPMLGTEPGRSHEFPVCPNCGSLVIEVEKIDSDKKVL